MPAFDLREARASDASALLHHLQTIADEPHNGISVSSAAELNMTEVDAESMIRSYTEKETALYVLALAGDGVIGEIHGSSGRLGYSGTVNLTMSVAQSWRDQGVGKALLCYMIDWCQANPQVHRLELYVFPDNPRALHLYQKMGFAHEGGHRQAYFKEGEYKDLLVMGMLFER